jgi:hypothetical protein
MESGIWDPGADIDTTFECDSEFRIDTPLFYSFVIFPFKCALNVKTFLWKDININELSVHVSALYFMKSYLYKFLECIIVNFESSF